MMDLLDLAQCQNNTFNLNQQYFSIKDVIGKSFKMVEHFASKKNVELILNEIDETHEPYYNSVFGDQHRFMQVIVNFLSNSLKFSNQDGKIIIDLKLNEISICKRLYKVYENSNPTEHLVFEEWIKFVCDDINEHSLNFSFNIMQ